MFLNVRPLFILFRYLCLVRRLGSLIIVLGVLTGCRSALAQPPQAETGQPTSEWVDLFDGQTLSGWIQRGGKARFFIDEDSIVGATVRGEPDSFLCTEAEYSDFELSLQFLVVDPLINSGIQFRSLSLPDYRQGVVHGYQIEIDPSDRRWTGGIYDQERRGWLVKLNDSAEKRSAYLPGKWNELRLICQNSSMQVWINDIMTAELQDNATRSGFIALQLHASSEAKELSIRWRRLRLRRL